jgi:hypothetical protein
VLAELNAALLNEPETGHRIVTVMFGILQPDPGGPGFLITLGTGGHEPAMWMRAETGDHGGDVVEVYPEGGMLLGAVADARFSACSVRLGPGEALLLYTDGLTDTPVDGEPFDCSSGRRPQPRPPPPDQACAIYPGAGAAPRPARSPWHGAVDLGSGAVAWAACSGELAGARVTVPKRGFSSSSPMRGPDRGHPSTIHVREAAEAAERRSG